jgi:hypothetical protein
MLTWNRTFDNIWIPAPQKRRGAAWLYNAVMAKKYQKWERVVEFLEAQLENLTPDPAQHERALALARELPNISVASVAISAKPSTSTSGPSSLSLHDDWQNGQGHRAFVNL